ncbi:MAG: hypothetical protein IKR19_08150 [Acholeplasmatales bacterium]|nr:hypothetical protein [Acholeplasmatales bacterium]
MLQILFASLNLSTTTGDGQDIIKALYSDLDPNMDYNDFVDLLNDLSGGTNDDLAYYAKMESGLLKEAFDEWKRSQKPFKKDSLNEHSINEYTVKTIYGKTLVTEAFDDPYRDENQQYKRNQEQRAQNKEKRDQQDQSIKRGRYNNDKQKYSDQKGEIARNLNKDRFTQQDAKKTNDLEPTLLVVNYNTVATDINGKIMNLVDRKSFVTGVKSRAIPVEPLEIVERFVTKEKTRLSFRNLIRATTGEMAFFKDFILCLDKIKLDAKNSAKKGPLAQYWHILERRSQKNVINKLKSEGNDGSAITTIVISQDSVNYMKSAYRFDLENINSAKMIMNSYNLLGLFIVDESTESVKVLYDGYNEFEVVSYVALERDFSEREYKKTINLINNQGR